jgi:hypothetical protein
MSSFLFNLKPLETIKLCKQNILQMTETLENIKELHPSFVDLLNKFDFSYELIDGKDLLIKNRHTHTTLIKEDIIKTFATSKELESLLSALSNSTYDIILEVVRNGHITGKVDDISFSINSNFGIAKYCKISKFTLNNGKIKAHFKYYKFEGNYAHFKSFLLEHSVKSLTIYIACSSVGLSEKLIGGIEYSEDELIVEFTEIVNDYLVEKYSNVTQDVNFVIGILKNIAQSVAGVEQINTEITNFQKKLEDFEKSKQNILYKELIAMQNRNEERKLKEQEKRLKEEEEKKLKEETEKKQKTELKTLLLNNAQKVVTTVAAKQHKLKVLQEIIREADIKKLKLHQVEEIKPIQIQPKILDKKTINEMIANAIKNSSQKAILLHLWECANKKDFNSEISKKQNALPYDPEFNILLDNLLALDYGERINFLLEHEIYSS